MADGHREVVVLGPRPHILPARAPRLVIDVESRRRRDVLRVHDVEILLAETLLPRLGVVHADDRLLRVVEGHVLHVVGVRIVGTRKTEIKELRPPEVVQRQRRLPQGSLGDVAHLLPVERIVDPVIGQRGVQRSDLDAVEIAAHVPFEVVQRADRVVEQIGLQRLADLPLLLGRVLRLLVLALLALGLLVRDCCRRGYPTGRCCCARIKVFASKPWRTHRLEALQKTDRAGASAICGSKISTCQPKSGNPRQR